MRFNYGVFQPLFGFILLTFITCDIYAQQLTTANKPAQLDIRQAGQYSLRITLKPVSFHRDFPYTPALVERKYPSPGVSLRTLSDAVTKRVGNFSVKITPGPLTVTVTNTGSELIQRITFTDDGKLTFKLDDQPVLGLGEGGPKPDRGEDWQHLPAEFDRRGRLFGMQPRWQSDAYGSRNPVPLMVGTSGWGLFIATPWGQVDLRSKDRGIFIPREAPKKNVSPQTQENQQLNAGKGLPPADSIVPGLFDLIVFDAHDPADFMKDVSTLSGPAVMPPKWALGYMQSHRTLEDDDQMIDIVDTFREKNIPVDAVIYLGTGFAPRGWNKEQPSFAFNPDVFHHDPKTVIDELHDRHVKVVLHMVPWDRDRLPTLHGNIPPKAGEALNASHIKSYWQEHVPLIKDGVDAFWPDEGDWFNLYERMERHKMYYQGPVSSEPDTRPWSLHRNGYLGIARWGGWVWSGDTQSTWKTLQTQIAVGLNYSLSLSPFWGSDIGGFYPTGDLTGELYARWFQFGAFCPSFRAHGRTWWTRLPWGWGLSERGPLETKTPPSKSDLNNPAIEPIAKKYDELRYRLLPYNYTLAWEARNSGMPFMRSLWLEFPDDEKARSIADEYLWGRDMLIAPVYKKGATSRSVYLPEGTWYDWWNGTSETGAKTISRDVDLTVMPIYVRAGAIIPFDPARQYTEQAADRPTTIKIYRGSDGDFTLYADDGISLDYLDGAFTLIRFTWDDKNQKLTIEPANDKKIGERTFTVQLLPEDVSKTVNYRGKALEVQF